MPIDTDKLRNRIGRRTVSEVARDANMQVPDLFRILSGRNTNPTLKNLEALARALKCKITDFIS